MRKIKYRVWDKVNKEWAKDFTLSQDGELLCDNGKTGFIRENFELIQYSGVKDRNNKEIYEGDIVVCSYWSKNGEKHLRIKGIVKYQTDAFILLEYSEYPLAWNVHDNLYGEIIGNIYENPELLEERNEN